MYPHHLRGNKGLRKQRKAAVLAQGVVQGSARQCRPGSCPQRAGALLIVLDNFLTPLHRDKETGKQRGFAFLAYEDQRSTVLAVDNLSGARVGGRTIRVDHVDNYKIKRAEASDALPPSYQLQCCKGSRQRSSHRCLCSVLSSVEACSVQAACVSASTAAGLRLDQGCRCGGYGAGTSSRAA